MSLSLSAHERCGPPSSCNVPYIPPFFSFFFSLSFPSILMYIPRTTSVQRTLHLYLRVEGSFSAMDTGIGRRPAVKFILLTWAATMILLLSRFSTADLYYRSGPGLYSPRNANLLYRVIRPCADRCISLSLSFSLSLSRFRTESPHLEDGSIVGIDGGQDRSSSTSSLDSSSPDVFSPWFIYKRVIALIPGIREIAIDEARF